LSAPAETPGAEPLKVGEGLTANPEPSPSDREGVETGRAAPKTATAAMVKGQSRPRTLRGRRKPKWYENRAPRGVPVRVRGGPPNLFPRECRFEVASGHPGDLRCHPGQDGSRQMTQHAIEGEGDVHRAACFRHPVRQIRDTESQAHAREPGQVTGDAPCRLDLRVGDIETSGRDVREPQLVCLSHDTPQPRAGPAAGVDNADGGCARRPQPAQPLADYPPDPPVRIGVRSLESKQAPRIAIGKVEIVVARSVRRPRCPPREADREADGTGDLGAAGACLGPCVWEPIESSG
jgi:hypothetical protein